MLAGYERQERNSRKSALKTEWIWSESPVARPVRVVISGSIQNVIRKLHQGTLGSRFRRLRSLASRS
jgi:hypothetical protein